ncbi:MAG: hypothetical protein AB1716_20255 [Planctomycetota bacterium]
MRRGVTLVELVLVITLTLVLSAAAIGGLRGVQSWRTSAAVRRVQADLDYARSLALLSGRRTLCRFDLAASSYELQQEPQPASGVIQGSPLVHPLDGRAWQVALDDLAAELTVTLQPVLTASAIGYGTDGLPVDANGTAVGQDVRLTFSNGAVLTLRSGSGLSEVTWP